MGLWPYSRERISILVHNFLSTIIYSWLILGLSTPLEGSGTPPMEISTGSCILRSLSSPTSSQCVDSCVWFAHLWYLFYQSLLLSLQRKSSLVELSPYFPRAGQLSSAESFLQSKQSHPYPLHSGLSDPQSKCPVDQRAPGCESVDLLSAASLFFEKVYPASFNFHLYNSTPYHQYSGLVNRYAQLLIWELPSENNTDLLKHVICIFKGYNTLQAEAEARLREK